ncbi:DNA-directed RNA polymerase I subunit rpa1 like protein [Verticillium longisporum]|nr:DNA-directed RNA polymerase I subunit rpa1 like protein [Verticillium longisporum]
MNISQPISSTVETVEFTFLTETEIRAISVKRIENDSTFDNLLNPVPGGLYDPALGSWGDSMYPLKKKAGKVSADMFFLQTLLVPPNRFRPEARTGDSEISEAQQNSLYKLVLRSCGTIARVHQSIGGATTERRARTMTDLHQAWTDLQNAVNSLIDKDKNPVMGAAAKRNEEGIKQKLEKKEGLFRKNMMGKRVNFAARSVISPDPNIETNEIVSYDSTVRDADGTLIQFLYGEDGLDPTKQKYLTDFGFILRNIESESAQLGFSSDFRETLAGNKDNILKHMKSAIKYAKAGKVGGKDPVISMVNPARVAFATSEKFYESMTEYIKENKDGLVREKGEKRPATNPTSTDAELLVRLEEVMRDDNKQEGLDMLMNQRSGELSQAITKACLPSGLVKQFPKNQMQAMTVSGAKGGPVNANLISCNLGQQVLEGRRVPLMEVALNNINIGSSV